MILSIIRQRCVIPLMGNNFCQVIQIMFLHTKLSVFVSEWGTINAVVKGKIVESNEQWQKWMNDHKLSSANWSLTNLVEDTEKKYGGDGQGGSYFAADFDPAKPDAEWKYSESGAWVNEHVFADLPKSYTKCKLLPAKNNPG